MVSQPLNDTQINYARTLIEKRHQLLDTPIELTLPFVRYLCCCLFARRKPSFKQALKRSLRHQLGIKVSKSDILLEKDPFLKLGYGMNAYFEIMLQLMYLATAISLIMVPFMCRYASFDSLQGTSGYFFNAISIGNLGGASTKCANVPLTAPDA